ncbi:adenosine deaminase [Kosakonia oryzendophytica]|uniref:adenosine deaminase n=1 Tax=Kosakonia oryzendophytica TaxID=1005665 RepID=A0A1C3ZAI4_9ENTR|nr:adenosine deaminase [Kosakonia oryzendophytica]AMO47864.1 Adenosine deaminase 1 [Enterobacter sp. FY-07]TDT58638.1 adenosine deaminase [Enterobacter sp. AG5470]WBT59548.1 adenosine deaminase [Kosakonia oryzendophytica]SCB79371.1 adenosine deaminase [Kosakonia oryzendophytica]
MLLKKFPLVDLHRHLDGNIDINTIIMLAQKYGVDLPTFDPEELRPYVQVTDNQPDLLSFLAKLDIGVSVLGSLEACHFIARQNVYSAFAEGLDYAELRFSPYYMAKAFNLPLEGVVQSVIDGVREGMAEFSVGINLIGILSRTWGVDSCMAELNALLTYRDDISGVDLAGDERNFPCRLFTEHFTKARDKGFRVTVHAGEAAGPESIRDAIKLLGAERIGHGVQAVNDPWLLEYMANWGIAVECCLTSNLQTNAVNDLANHPVKTFLDYGIIATLNTDDPFVEGVTLRSEYERAVNDVGLTKEHISQLQRNGLNAAFISEGERIKFIMRKLQNGERSLH